MFPKETGVLLFMGSEIRMITSFSHKTSKGIQNTKKGEVAHRNEKKGRNDGVKGKNKVSYFV